MFNRQQCSSSARGQRGCCQRLMTSLLQVSVVSLCLVLSMNFDYSHALPTRHYQTKESDSLSNIIRDMEDAIFRLKEFSLRLDYENRKSDVDFDDPLSELKHRHVQLDESYPEVVGELHEKKSADDAPNSPSAQQQAVATKPEVAASNSKDQVPDTQSTQQQSPSSSTGSNPTKKLPDGVAADDLSLREALEFLVGLAKEKKQEKKAKELAST